MRCSRAPARQKSSATSPIRLPCLHPGRSARITRRGKTIGWIGELHPQLVQEFDFTYAPILFEVEYSAALAAKMPRFEEISRFPRVRRDLAVVVDEKVSLRQLHERVTFAASSLLRDIRVFDVFQGARHRNRKKKRRFRLDISGQFSHPRGRGRGPFVSRDSCRSECNVGRRISRIKAWL